MADYRKRAPSVAQRMTTTNSSSSLAASMAALRPLSATQRTRAASVAALNSSRSSRASVSFARSDTVYEVSPKAGGAAAASSASAGPLTGANRRSLNVQADTLAALLNEQREKENSSAAPRGGTGARDANSSVLSARSGGGGGGGGGVGHAASSDDPARLRQAAKRLRSEAERLALEGMPQEVVKKRRDILRVLEALYGSSVFNVEFATGQFELGVSLYDAGAFAEAVSVLQAAHKLVHRVQDQTYFQCSIQLALGNAQLMLGKSDDAMVSLRRACDTLEALHGKHYPGLVAPLANIGLLLARQRKHDEALAVLLRARKLGESVLGSTADKTHLASVYHNLGFAYDSQGNSSEAIAAYRRSLEVSERATADGKNSPAYAHTAAMLAGALFGAGKTSEALALQRQVLKSHEHVYGGGHPATADAEYTLALFLAAAGRLREALTHVLACIDTRVACFGKDAAATTAALLLYDRIDRAQPRADADSDAAEQYQRVAPALAETDASAAADAVDQVIIEGGGRRA